tara:strand:+ start:5669 stop:6277 length:609 start_codon:yes stop_codon:yes gene_type:complete
MADITIDQIVAGTYDIEAYQAETLELFLSYVSDADRVQDFSDIFPGQPDERQYALTFAIRPKDSDLENNNVLIDSINDFDIVRARNDAIDGNFVDNLGYFLGRATDGTAIGQAELTMNSGFNPDDLKSYTFKLHIPMAVMREMEPGNYYYTLHLVERPSAAISWDYLYQGAASTQKTLTMMTGKFRVHASMTRDVEDGQDLG